MTSLDPYPDGRWEKPGFPETPSMPTAMTPSTEPIGLGRGECMVVFHRFLDDNWPLEPAESVPAQWRGPYAAELTGIPVLSHGISRGDVVAFSRDGDRLHGRHVRSPSGHSTAHAVATGAAELVPIAAAVGALGAEVQLHDHPPMLAIDIPPDVALPVVEAVLASALSMTCNFEISCDQHTGARQ